MMRRKHRGIALLTAIWVLAVLLVLVGGFAAMTHSETLVARNFGDLTRARWAARTGVRRAEAELLSLAALPYTDLGGARLLLSPEDNGETEGDTVYETVVEDEAGKLNLNTAGVEALSAFFPAEVVEAILDWRDEDSTPETDGAEDDYYTRLTPPYHCKNGAFETVDELLLVKGVTREMLETVVTEDGQTLADLLTVVSGDRNTDAEDQPRLNIRTASQSALTSRCGDVLTPEEIAAVIQARTASPLTGPADLLRVPNLSREKVAQVFDRLTGTDEQELPGLVNLNTAPAEVLAVLPGMDAAAASAIVDHREANGPFIDVGELLSVEGLSDTTLTRVASQVTTRSQRFRVIATGQYRDEITSRITCIVQTEGQGDTASTRMLYWHE